MKYYTTIDPDYILAVDRYPYIESVDLLKSLEWWWDHPSRKKFKEKKNNYSLDDSLPNSILSSFKNKMLNGNFSFLYYQDRIISYQGLMISKDGKNSYSHRYASTPENFHLGTYTGFVIPWHIKESIELGCEYYNMGWEEVNKKHYEFVTQRRQVNNRLYKIRHNDTILDLFDDMGLVNQFRTQQYVLRLDLKKDLSSILNRNPFIEK